jgi:hypothetical protein
MVRSSSLKMGSAVMNLRSASLSAFTVGGLGAPFQRAAQSAYSRWGGSLALKFFRKEPQEAADTATLVLLPFRDTRGRVGRRVTGKPLYPETKKEACL